MATPSKKTNSMVPRSSDVISILLIVASCVTATTLGFDGSMMNGLNILPSYTDYFSLDTTTLALNTSSVWLGGAISGLFYGKVTDLIGRKQALLWAAVFTVFSAILQAAAQNITMFVIARIMIGVGTGGSGCAAPTYMAETLPLKYRAWGLSMLYNCWYIGGLLAAGITYGTAEMNSTWAWRIPSAIQGIFSVICVAFIPFIPESPRWLANQGRLDEALEVVALTYADGDALNPLVLVQYQEICDTMKREKEAGETISVMQTIKTPSSRRRLWLALSVAVFTVASGNNIISYYLGGMLDNAGITDSTTQLEINIILNAWCLVVSLIGTSFMDKGGRKFVALTSTFLLTIFIFMIGGLTAGYGTSSNTAGVYGTVASIFLFQGSYSFGWTPLSNLYPPEVLNYPIRANGMAIYQFVCNGVGLLVTFAFPYALDNIGWKTYMINGAWDVLEFLFVLYLWIETKGKTLEEIDDIFAGTKHSNVPDLEAIMNGKVEIGEILEGLEPSTMTTEDIKSVPVMTIKKD